MFELTTTIDLLSSLLNQHLVRLLKLQSKEFQTYIYITKPRELNPTKQIIYK